MDLEDLYSQIPSEAMKVWLRSLPPEEAEAECLRHLSLSEKERKNVEAFFDSQGPERMQKILEELDDTPSVEDLESWFRD